MRRASQRTPYALPAVYCTSKIVDVLDVSAGEMATHAVPRIRVQHIVYIREEECQLEGCLEYACVVLYRGQYHMLCLQHIGKMYLLAWCGWCEHREVRLR
jgi:hypothetical protein